MSPEDLVSKSARTLLATPLTDIAQLLWSDAKLDHRHLDVIDDILAQTVARMLSDGAAWQDAMSYEDLIARLVPPEREGNIEPWTCRWRAYRRVLDVYAERKRLEGS